MTELLLGCGFAREKLMAYPVTAKLAFEDLITVDHNARCLPDILCDLDDPVWYPKDPTNKGMRCIDGHRAQHIFHANFFDEIHAYEVLEHLGRLGDAESFFSTFGNIHRMLKPGGLLFATCPSRHSPWAFGDPSHRRIISQESLLFLSQKHIAENRRRNTQMSDFSDIWGLDFEILASGDDHAKHSFCLRAIK
jgi:Methyltransferase domain